ncbi:phage holin, LLH family [Lactobacillus apis]|uniref:phage holin, LLH family n=1 Tax=Lactobacillus apis TaxID=303541 RepID=UPI00242CE3DB|nr:phage holin, LLH family [Lactobacillus apis]
MNNLTFTLQLLSTVTVIIAFLFVGIYPYIQKHDKPLADKIDIWYKIAQLLVNNEATKMDKAGSDKKQAATKALLNQAKQLKIPLDKNVAASLVQQAYNYTQTTKDATFPDTDYQSEPAMKRV